MEGSTLHVLRSARPHTLVPSSEHIRAALCDLQTVSHMRMCCALGGLQLEPGQPVDTKLSSAQIESIRIRYGIFEFKFRHTIPFSHPTIPPWESLPESHAEATHSTHSIQLTRRPKLHSPLGVLVYLQGAENKCGRRRTPHSSPLTFCHPFLRARERCSTGIFSMSIKS